MRASQRKAMGVVVCFVFARVLVLRFGVKGGTKGKLQLFGSPHFETNPYLCRQVTVVCECVSSFSFYL